MGQGVITSSRAISGSAPFRVYMPGDEVPEGESAVWALDTAWTAENPRLGSSTVIWHFEPAD